METVARVLFVDSQFVSMLREVRWLYVLEKKLVSLCDEKEDLFRKICSPPNSLTH